MSDEELATLRVTNRYLSRLERDAERYRWLAEGGHVVLPYTEHWRSKEWLDAAIDAAMKESPASQPNREPTE